MSAIVSNSEYTIYKTTTGELEARLMFQVCEMKQTCKWDLVSAAYRDHCKLPTDKMVWRHVIHKYGKRILTLPELLIASTLSHPDTTIYLVEQHFPSDRRLDLIDIYGITGETILKMRQILEKYQVPLTEFDTLMLAQLRDDVRALKEWESRECYDEGYDESEDESDDE